MTTDSHGKEPQATPCFWHYDQEELRRAAAAVEGLKNAVGTVNPRLPGRRNDLVQLVKKWLARVLAWYTRPAHEFNASVSWALKEVVSALEHLSMNMLALEHLSLNIVALEGRLAQSENRNAALVEAMQEQIDLLLEQVKATKKTTNPEASARPMETSGRKRSPEGLRFYIDAGVGNNRTAYIIGLFGSGRHYINELMLQNIGERAKYFRDTIRLHPGPTPMIYSGHATMKHVSRAQASPEIMGRILGAVRSGFADLIFVYRHPLDSLLSNWIWWRTYIRDNIGNATISQLYKNRDDLCVDLEQNFPEFKAFAEGDLDFFADFFAAVPGPRFLSFPEFVEEAELYLHSATLTLRLEDFMIDPFKEFSKIVEVMSVDIDLSRLRVAPPRTKPYGYLAVKEKVPRFRNFINELDAETKRRIKKIGYL